MPITDQLRALGIHEGTTLLVHCAFSKVGPLDGGPLGLITALESVLGPAGTLVMPTMTDGDSRFDPRTTPTDQMGIVAETFWRQPGVLRSAHPSGSFAARGPHAPFITQAQPLSPPHGPRSPVDFVRELDGQILLLGVGHSENTTLHLAEALAPVPYSVEHPCVVGDETVMIAETDHCCRGFAIADQWLRSLGLQHEGTVGNADARLMRSRDVVRVAVEHLRLEPLIFLADDCEECTLARASIKS